MPGPASQIAQTSCGAIEYAIHGKGQAVLLCHGTGGGFDQGLMLARLLDGFQGIAVSRAGYLRTPLSTGASPSEMADADAAILDWLQIEKAAERRLGVQNDLEHIHRIDGFQWEEIQVPTLLIHGDQDRLIPLVYSQEAARRIPHAELFIIQGGGHECLVSHRRETVPRLQFFLLNLAASS